MRSVGVKQLKARLSEYIRRARAGEVILVTDRNEVVAELRAPRQSALPLSSEEEAVESLVQSGTLTRASRPLAGWRWKPVALGLPAGSAQALLDALREERS